MEWTWRDFVWNSRGTSDQGHVIEVRHNTAILRRPDGSLVACFAWVGGGWRRDGNPEGKSFQKIEAACERVIAALEATA